MRGWNKRLYEKRSVKFDFLVEEIVNNIIMFVWIFLIIKFILYMYILKSL